MFIVKLPTCVYVCGGEGVGGDVVEVEMDLDEWFQSQFMPENQMRNFKMQILSVLP